MLWALKKIVRLTTNNEEKDPIVRWDLGRDHPLKRSEWVIPLPHQPPPAVYSTPAHRNVNPTLEPIVNVFLSCLTCFSQTGHDMYGLNENNGLAARCQTVFCQEHPGNWKGSALTWPTGRVLRGSGLAVFHTEKALKSGGLPEGLRPWCMHVRCSAACELLCSRH